MKQNNIYLISLVDRCREQNEIGERKTILESINGLLPAERKIRIPSLITNTCIDNILSSIEARLSPPVYPAK